MSRDLFLFFISIVSDGVFLVSFVWSRLGPGMLALLYCTCICICKNKSLFWNFLLDQLHHLSICPFIIANWEEYARSFTTVFIKPWDDKKTQRSTMRKPLETMRSALSVLRKPWDLHWGYWGGSERPRGRHLWVLGKPRETLRSALWVLRKPWKILRSLLLEKRTR